MSSSILIAVGMALNNDDVFVLRLKTACSLIGVDYTQDLAEKAVVKVLDQIQVREGPAICTDAVEDSRILSAIGEITGREEQASSIIAMLQPSTEDK